MLVNEPKALAEVTAAFARYETALVSNDVAKCVTHGVVSAGSGMIPFTRRAPTNVCAKPVKLTTKLMRCTHQVFVGDPRSLRSDGG